MFLVLFPLVGLGLRSYAAVTLLGVRIRVCPGLRGFKLVVHLNG